MWLKNNRKWSPRTDDNKSSWPFDILLSSALSFPRLICIEWTVHHRSMAEIKSLHSRTPPFLIRIHWSETERSTFDLIRYCLSFTEEFMASLAVVFGHSNETKRNWSTNKQRNKQLSQSGDQGQAEAIWSPSNATWPRRMTENSEENTFLSRILFTSSWSFLAISTERMEPSRGGTERDIITYAKQKAVVHIQQLTRRRTHV